MTEIKFVLLNNQIIYFIFKHKGHSIRHAPHFIHDNRRFAKRGFYCLQAFRLPRRLSEFLQQCKSDNTHHREDDLCDI